MSALEQPITIKAFDIWYVIDLIFAAAKNAGSQKALAQEWGISEQYLSDILKGRREPGNKVLKQLGLRKMVIYTEKEPTREPGWMGDISGLGADPTTP